MKCPVDVRKGKWHFLNFGLRPGTGQNRENILKYNVKIIHLDIEYLRTHSLGRGRETSTNR